MCVCVFVCVCVCVCVCGGGGGVNTMPAEALEKRRLPCSTADTNAVPNVQSLGTLLTAGGGTWQVQHGDEGGVDEGASLETSAIAKPILRCLFTARE